MIASKNVILCPPSHRSTEPFPAKLAGRQDSQILFSIGYGSSSVISCAASCSNSTIWTVNESWSENGTANYDDHGNGDWTTTCCTCPIDRGIGSEIDGSCPCYDHGFGSSRVFYHHCHRSCYSTRYAASRPPPCRSPGLFYASRVFRPLFSRKQNGGKLFSSWNSSQLKSEGRLATHFEVFELFANLYETEMQFAAKMVHETLIVVIDS